MELSNLKPPRGSRKKPKRVGRGPGSGHGKTACRGHKGQRSRSSGNVRPGFEGGQMPLVRRLPKRGFRNPNKKVYTILNVRDLEHFETNAIVDPQSLISTGVIRKTDNGIKILAEGNINKPLTVKVHKISSSARAKIEAAGGNIEEI
ncbi:MAG: 50S ribosomal protein L15 [Deltaproteobacteria bacterium]|nr:50S ribosomal protein L15 [Deltaproteobacteria bacterium]MBW2308738.1 50S ribosomal protein L15 [Deltaproteobacteria bacterium]